jgi:hypothetical protein
MVGVRPSCIAVSCLAMVDASCVHHAPATCSLLAESLQAASTYGMQPNPMGFHEGARRVVKCDGGHITGFDAYMSHLGGVPEPTLNALRVLCSSSRVLIEYESGSFPDTAVFGNLPPDVVNLVQPIRGRRSAFHDCGISSIAAAGAAGAAAMPGSQLRSCGTPDLLLVQIQCVGANCKCTWHAGGVWTLSCFCC